MGWFVKRLSDEENIHSLFYRIMEEADLHGGQDAAHYTGKFLYRNMKTCCGFCTFQEGDEEPCGVILFLPDELKFLYVADVEGKEEIAHSLLEHALDVQKDSSCHIFSMFPSWKDTLGQDLLSPQMEEAGFKELHLIRVITPLDSSNLRESLSRDFLSPLKSAGYSFRGWKKKEHLSEVIALLLKNPSPLVAELFGGADQKGREWLERQLFTGDLGQEFNYPPECSTVVEFDSHIVGVFLCEERGWINQIAVDANHTRHGIASVMMQRAYKALKVLEAKSMALSVYRENPIAFSWYRRLGFEKTMEHPVWVWKKTGDSI